MNSVNVNLATGNASDSRIIDRKRLDAFVLEFSVRHCAPPGSITVKFSGYQDWLSRGSLRAA